MARGGDTRSPSPAGSYSSRRSRRNDERRDQRDDRRHDRRRRSRSPRSSRNERDRDYARRRSPDRRGYRREDDGRRPRDRSHDRHRVREYSPSARDRDRWANDHDRDKDRARDRGDRDRRDNSRDRERRRRDDSVDSRPSSRREDPKTRHSTKSPLRETNHASSKNFAADKAAEEEKKKAERLAKLEAWKQKQKLKDADRPVSSPTISADARDSRTASPTTTAPLSPATPVAEASPAPYAGKFDPKAIARRAAEKVAASTRLGDDIAIPVSTSKGSAPLAVPSQNGSHANQQKDVSSQVQNKASRLKASGNLSGFGLSRSTAEVEKSTGKRALDFGEEESTRKKLERLPTPPLQDLQDTDNSTQVEADEEDDGDDDVDIHDSGSDTEGDAAARAAAEERKDRFLAQTGSEQPDAEQDTSMPDLEAVPPATDTASAPEDSSAQQAAMDVDEDEEADPLDAFMAGLDNSKGPKAPGLSRAIDTKQKRQAPEAFFSDDDDEFSTIKANPGDILEMASKARKKKDIATVNHAKMNYESFRKNFYTEPLELASMTASELADLRLELDGIKVEGTNVPKPVQKWSQLGLGTVSLDVIQKLGYERPTSIQAQAIPAIMSGRDVIGTAKTGSGKTMAFLLPMFRHIKDQRPLDSLDGPIGLIVTPTRELATQIHKECRPWLKALNIRAVCAYGGAPIKDQIADLKRGAEIIVCTPGRMIDLLAANSGRVTNLRRVTYVVLDEADRMFDMGFGPQVTKILVNVRPERQTVLFSATLPPKIQKLARDSLTDQVEITVGGRSVVAPEIKQIVEVRNEDTKFVRTLKLLGDVHESDDNARSLIFVDRQESAESLMNDIMRKGYPCFTIHGGKDQFDRDSVISDYKNGIFPVLVATSVAARGLDVKELKLVINYDCPNHLEDYVHRAGRTGRAGNTGLAVTFITEEQGRYAVDIAKALKQSGQDVPDEVQNLADDFLAKVKEGKEKASGSGFGGKGLERLDQERDAARNRERKTYKTGDEPDEDEKPSDDNKPDAADDFVVKSSAAVASEPAAIPSTTQQNLGIPKGIDLDGAITVHRSDPADAAAGGTTGKDRDTAVSDAVRRINERLIQQNVIRPNAPVDNKGPDAGAFHATLEINDFPQKARWAVTNRTNVAKILEATGTSITTKGNFYKDREPGATDPPKLYILVEGDTELVVTTAMRELMRLLKDATTAAMDTEARAPASGRYSVV